MSTVSIIIPIYNSEDYLHQSLDSILNQTYTDLELVCINDGSTDSTQAILDEYASKDRRVRVFTQENKGVAAALNVGLDRAQGDYICFFGSDDFYELDTMEKAVTRAKQVGAEVVLFSFNFYHHDTGRTIGPAPFGVRSELVPDPTRFNWREIPDRIFNIKDPSNATAMFSARIFKDNPWLRYVTCEFAEDLPVAYPALILAKTISIIDEPLYNYRVNRPGSICTAARKGERNFFESLQLLHDNLKRLGVLDQIKPSYRERVIMNLRSWAIHSTSIRSRHRIVRFLKSKGLGLLEIDDFNPEAILGKNQLMDYYETFPFHTISVIVIEGTRPSNSAAFLEGLAKTKVQHTLTFVKDVAELNKALENTVDHIAIVQSDAQLPQDWAERLFVQIMAVGDPPPPIKKSAMNFPFSNAASITAYPWIWHDNPLANDLELDAVDDVFKTIQPLYTEIPSSAPLCVAMSRNAYREVGGFNPELDYDLYVAFAEWCTRARRLGWRVNLVENLFVQDTSTGRDPVDRYDLAYETAEALKDDYPDYNFSAHDYMQFDAACIFKEFLNLKFEMLDITNHLSYNMIKVPKPRYVAKRLLQKLREL
ncbi:MAG: glycosyltransferase [Coriobacteriales bacterium]|jgi:glycosyltransferase involved in cell wall biosynthesis|nr:glycosyltransferase [Coriobacteriales bacterium]